MEKVIGKLVSVKTTLTIVENVVEICDHETYYWFRYFNQGSAQAYCTAVLGKDKVKFVATVEV